MQYLLDHGADIHAYDGEGRNLFNMVAQSHSMESIQCLLNNITIGDITCSEHFHTPNRNLLAMDLSPDGDVMRRVRLTPSLDFNISIQQVLKNAADIVRKDRSIGTVLHVLVHYSSAEVIQYYLKDCAIEEINFLDGSERTPLHYAARHGSETAIQYLIDKGRIVDIDINARDRNGQTPLHLAAERGCPEAIACLLNNGAEKDINVRDRNGKTPLHLAAEHGCPEAIACLLNNGAEKDINVRDRNGQTPLHLAAEHGCPEAIACLLDNGAEKDINVRDKHGKTPFSLAMTNIYSSTRSLPVLLASGAISDISTDDINQRNLSKWDNLHINVLLVLLKTGTRINIAEPTSKEEEEEKGPSLSPKSIMLRELGALSPQQFRNKCAPSLVLRQLSQKP